MRIVLVNWARIWDGASHGGGVNGYVQALALALRARAHDVVSLCGGTTVTDPGAPCAIRRHDDWLGIRVFELINSPVLAPSLAQFRDPKGEIDSRELVREFTRFVGLVHPDIIHWNNVEGFTASCVRACADLGIRTVISLHNYHTICPQVYLMQGHRRACHSFRAGTACIGCVDAVDPSVERARRATAYASAHGPQGPTAGEQARLRLDAARADVRRQWGWPVRAARSIRELWRARRALRAVPDVSPPVPLPGIALASADDAAAPRSITTDGRGGTQAILDQARPPWRPDHDDPERAPLLNVVEPDPSPRDSWDRSGYAQRRDAMIGALNSCDRILAVSTFVARKFASLGVDESRLVTMPIGTRMREIVARAPELVFDPPPFDRDRPRPLRLVFLGYSNYYKGLGMLYESLEMLDAADLARLDLHVYAFEGQNIEWLFRRLQPRLANLTWANGYQFHEIPWILGGKDLGVVCSVWWDNGPQTVLECLACRVPVLGAELGGIPDVIQHNVNGLLFRGNDRRALADALQRVAREPWITERLRAGIRPPAGMEEHADAMASLYAALHTPHAAVLTGLQNHARSRA